MKTIVLMLFSGLLFCFYSQDIRVERAVPNPGANDWGNDISVYNFQPLGRMSGVQKSDNTLYVAVNDTMSTSNLGIVVYTSTNSGSSWMLYPTGITYRDQLQNLKMVKSPDDSIYVFFNNYSVISCWNVNSGSVNMFTNYPAGYRDFDVVCSSTGSLYLLADLLANRDVRIFGSTNGGFSWGSSLYLSSTGAEIKGSISGTGDTILINYYGVTIQPDTATSAIRSVRYRETTPGTLSITGSFTTPIPFDGLLRKQFKAASGNGEAWLVYTQGQDGTRIIYGMKSIDQGVSFGAPEVLSVSSNTDNYFFDIRYMPETGNGGPGFAFIYYSDSLQTGSPDSSSDKLMFSIASYGGSFGPPVQVSSIPPCYSDAMYIPQLISMPLSNDIGALWVGENASGRKLYWDRLLAVIPVELSSFNASINGKAVELSWSTTTETNNSGFAVERNVSGTWMQAAFISGNGTTTIPQRYTYTDYLGEVSAGIIKYRLRQVDFNGSTEYSDIIEVNLSAVSSYLLEQNYPNPFNPSTKISYSIPEKSFVQLKIVDMLGRQVEELVNTEQAPGSYNIEFNGSSFASGMYIYTLKAGSTILTKSMLLVK